MADLKHEDGDDVPTGDVGAEREEAEREVWWWWWYDDEIGSKFVNYIQASRIAEASRDCQWWGARERSVQDVRDDDGGHMLYMSIHML